MTDAVDSAFAGGALSYSPNTADGSFYAQATPFCGTEIHGVVRVVATGSQYNNNSRYYNPFQGGTSRVRVVINHEGATWDVYLKHCKDLANTGNSKSIMQALYFAIPVGKKLYVGYGGFAGENNNGYEYMNVNYYSGSVNQWADVNEPGYTPDTHWYNYCKPVVVVLDVENRTATYLPGLLQERGPARHNIPELEAFAGALHTYVSPAQINSYNDYAASAGFVHNGKAYVLHREVSSSATTERHDAAGSVSYPLGFNPSAFVGDTTMFTPYTQMGPKCWPTEMFRWRTIGRSTRPGLPGGVDELGDPVDFVAETPGEWVTWQAREVVSVPSEWRQGLDVAWGFDSYRGGKAPTPPESALGADVPCKVVATGLLDGSKLFEVQETCRLRRTDVLMHRIVKDYSSLTAKGHGLYYEGRHDPNGRYIVHFEMEWWRCDKVDVEVVRVSRYGMPTLAFSSNEPTFLERAALPVVSDVVTTNGVLAFTTRRTDKGTVKVHSFNGTDVRTYDSGLTAYRVGVLTAYDGVFILPTDEGNGVVRLTYSRDAVTWVAGHFFKVDAILGATGISMQRPYMYPYQCAIMRTKVGQTPLSKLLPGLGIY